MTRDPDLTDRLRFRLPWSRAYLPLLLALILLGIVLIQKEGTISAFQFKGIANHALPLALVAIGETIVILVKGIDLSIAGVISLASAVTVVVGETNGVLGVFAALAVGTAAGLINGLVVSYGKITPLIVTLATGSIFGGLALFVLPIPGGSAPAWLRQATVGTIGDFPVAAIWLVVLTIGGWFVLNRTSFGVAIRCLGMSEESSWSNGLPTRRVLLQSYSAGGFFAALAGVSLVGLTSSGDPNIGTPYLLTGIAAVVVGGTELFNGVGTLAGTVFGAVVLSLVSTVLFSSGLPTDLQFVVNGLIVIGALAGHSVRRVRGRVRANRRDRPEGVVVR